MRAQQVINDVLAETAVRLRDRLIANGYPTHAIAIDVGGRVTVPKSPTNTGADTEEKLVGGRQSWSEHPDEAVRRRNAIPPRREFGGNSDRRSKP